MTIGMLIEMICGRRVCTSSRLNRIPVEKVFRLDNDELNEKFENSNGTKENCLDSEVGERNSSSVKSRSKSSKKKSSSKKSPEEYISDSDEELSSSEDDSSFYVGDYEEGDLSSPEGGEDLPPLLSEEEIEQKLNAMYKSSGKSISKGDKVPPNWGDATPFQKDFSLRTICDELKSMGINEFCDEQMINGLTGEPMKCLIFTGVCYYQRLKHMVIDKVHARSRGGRTRLTRQPRENFLIKIVQGA